MVEINTQWSYPARPNLLKDNYQQHSRFEILMTSILVYKLLFLHNCRQKELYECS